LGLKKLKIQQLFAIIGGSIGGAIAWEMTALQPTITQKLIPIATDHQTSDWLNAHCMVQKYLLEIPEENLEKARIHAMLCYRTPDSINKRFGNAIETKTLKRKSEEWLLYHGKTLKKRYKKESYQLMNHLLTTIDVDIHKIVNSSVEIHLVAIDTDLYFPAKTIRETYHLFNKNHKNTSYHEIISEYGHDGFLIEYEQLNKILTPIFNYYEQPYHYHLQEQSAY
jgi:homoserine O-acetyltransferase